MLCALPIVYHHCNRMLIRRRCLSGLETIKCGWPAHDVVGGMAACGAGEPCHDTRESSVALGLTLPRFCAVISVPPVMDPHNDCLYIISVIILTFATLLSYVDVSQPKMPKISSFVLQ